jgi:hypothetical protein
MEPGGKGLTERQKKWLASVEASLQRDTGRTLEEWVAIARTSPETKPRARTAWLKEHYGLGVNRAALVLAAALPPEAGWDQPDKLRAALWSNPAARRIFETLEPAVTALPDVVTGQRKGYTAFSRKVQFAAARPLKDGGVMLGLAVEPENDPRLEPSRNESWSERLRARLRLSGPDDVDVSLAALLKQAWEKS